MSFLSYMPIFCSLAWLEAHQEHGHTWRMLMVLDQSFGWFGQFRCVGSSKDTHTKFFLWKFCEYLNWFGWYFVDTQNSLFVCLFLFFCLNYLWIPTRIFSKSFVMIWLYLSQILLINKIVRFHVRLFCIV